MSWIDGLLVGAVLGSIRAAVVLPAIEQISAPEPIKITLVRRDHCLSYSRHIDQPGQRSVAGRRSDYWVLSSHSDRRCERAPRSYLVALLAACSRTAFQQC